MVFPTNNTQNSKKTLWDEKLKHYILPILALFVVGFTGGCAGRPPADPTGTHTPAEYAPEREHQYEVYYVKEGDTLHSIGRRMEVPWQRILETNDCSPEDIKAGQVLLIPLHARERPSGGTRPRETQPTPRDTAPPASIVIDPGHGGKDPGAISSSGFQEKDINLAVARQVARLLEQKGFNVVMTRRGDDFIELDERAAIASRTRADLFVSIHADASLNASARGYTLYVRKGASRRSRSVAQALENGLTGNKIRSRGIREADYRVLAETNIPAILIELGFLSNVQEANMLRRRSTQNRLAENIAMGIEQFITTR